MLIVNMELQSMKPQDSNTAQSSSQTQEGALANEPVEGLSTSIEQHTIEKEKNISFQREKLQGIITSLENDITSGYWIIAYYENIDLKMMPALVKQANKKYPEMNLQFALTPQDFAHSLQEAIGRNVQCSRYIVNTQEKGNHFAVIDHQTIENKASVIFFEPTTFMNNINATLLGLRIKQAIEECQLPECYFSMAEMDIQRSPSECGIISLALAKKFHTEAEELTRMHKDNVRGVLCEPDTHLPPDKLDSYLPARFYKHTQGAKRLREYIKSNPETENQKVNKKGETLGERFKKNLVTKEGKAVSVSLHKKRITEYKSLMI